MKRISFLPWSSLTALGLLLTAPACTDAETSELATTSQAMTEFAVTVGDNDSAYQELQVELNGRPSSLEEVAKLLGDATAEGKELVAVLEGKETPVEGATSTLSAQQLRIDGFKKIAENSTGPVGVWATFYVEGHVIRIRLVLVATPDEAMERARAQASEMYAIIDDLAKRYPNMEKVDQAAFVEAEAANLEKIATLYCLASGKEAVCNPDLEEGGVQKTDTRWWEWVIFYFQATSKVGVIPNGPSCPAEYGLVQIYHDDEDNNNANSRWGWMGGTVSNTNTLFRFCRVPGIFFRPLQQQGSQYNYAVLRLSAFCPAGTTRHTFRHYDNEDRNNANWGSSNIFPNVNLLGKNWVNAFCVFEGGASLPQMAGFPNFGFGYGVFANGSSYSLQTGGLYKDDEDNFNLNFWVDGPSTMMGGGSNTWLNQSRVK